MITIEWIRLQNTDSGVLNRGPDKLELPSRALVPAALLALGYTPSQIDAMLNKRAVAVFGLYATAHTVLHAGDRLEILDELQFNPMESRRRRQAHKIQIEGKKPPRKSVKRIQIDQHKDT
jgi:putative ubiquitin-RnfH superfamily antitoxin RatB of RatAB toxin-antitoxin module